MADDTRALNFNLNQKRVAVAIRPCGNDFQAIAGSFAFGPQLVAGSAVKRHVPQGLRAVPCGTVHKAEHQDFAVAGVLHDSWNQALHFVEVNFHKKISNHKGHEDSRRKQVSAKPVPSSVLARLLVTVLLPSLPRFEYQNKKPAELYASAGLKIVLPANSAAHPRRRAMRVVAMVMVASQHESSKLRDGVRPVNSKELMGIIGIRNGVSVSFRCRAKHTQ